SLSLYQLGVRLGYAVSRSLQRRSNSFASVTEEPPGRRGSAAGIADGDRASGGVERDLAFSCKSPPAGNRRLRTRGLAQWRARDVRSPCLAPRRVGTRPRDSRDVERGSAPWPLLARTAAPPRAERLCASEQDPNRPI